MANLISCTAAMGLAIGFTAGPSPWSQPVGQLVNVVGPVEIQRPNQPVKKGVLLFPLRRGDVLWARAGGRAELVLYENGARFALSAGSAARVEPSTLILLSGPRPQTLPALSDAYRRPMKMPAAPVPSKILGEVVRAQEDPTRGPRHPSPNGAVRGDAVELGWEGPIKAEKLRLRIRDEKSTVYSPADLPRTARKVKVPAGILRPGKWYVWSVTAVSGGHLGLECRGLLRLLLPAERTDLEQMQRELQRVTVSVLDDPVPILLLAQAYERFGLFDEALTAYRVARQGRQADEGLQAAVKRMQQLTAPKAGPP